MKQKCQKNVAGVTEKAGSERLLVLVTHTSCLLSTICNSVSHRVSL